MARFGHAKARSTLHPIKEQKQTRTDVRVFLSKAYVGMGMYCYLDDKIFVDDAIFVYQWTTEVDAHFSVVTTADALNEHESAKNRCGVRRTAENVNALIEQCHRRIHLALRRRIFDMLKG